MTALAEFHDELRAVARDVLAPTSPLVSGGEPVAARWQTLAEAGFLGLEVPEEHGGAGASFAEVAVVLEEVGRAATAGPVLGAVLAVGALGLVDPSAERDDLLAAIAAGDVLATVALPPDAVAGAAGATGVAGAARVTGGGAPLPFRVDGAGGAPRLTGRARFVPDAPGAERILVVADDPAGGAVLVDVAAAIAPDTGIDAGPDAGPDAGLDAGPDAGLAVTAMPVVDATRSFGEVVADGIPVDEARCWPLAGDVGDLLTRGALSVALDSVGITRAALDATVAYASDRHQFGRPIGSFQAVKHACADVAAELTISSRLVADAVERFVAGPSDAQVATSMAKAHATEAAVAAVGTALQLHGGIGYTWEHGVHALLKRAALDRSLFGSPAAHRARLAQRWAPPASM